MIDHFLQYPRKIFLIDGLGALLSALLLAGVLANCPSFFGIPKSTCYILASFPIVFSLYDFYWFFNKKEIKSSSLKRIAMCNFFYCILSIGFLIKDSGQISKWGVLYIFAELMIVVILARIEYRIAQKMMS